MSKLKTLRGDVVSKGVVVNSSCQGVTHPQTKKTACVTRCIKVMGKLSRITPQAKIFTNGLSKVPNQGIRMILHGVIRKILPKKKGGVMGVTKKQILYAPNCLDF